MIRQLTVDFNRVVEGSMIRTNASRAVTGTELEVGQTIVVGDDIWGVVRSKWSSSIKRRGRWCCA